MLRGVADLTPLGSEDEVRAGAAVTDIVNTVAITAIQAQRTR